MSDYPTPPHECGVCFTPALQHDDRHKITGEVHFSPLCCHGCGCGEEQPPDASRVAGSPSAGTERRDCTGAADCPADTHVLGCYRSRPTDEDPTPSPVSPADGGVS